MPCHSTILLIILTGRPATPAEISDFEEKWSEIFTELSVVLSCSPDLRCR
jgi:hypothetical protein